MAVNDPWAVTIEDLVETVESLEAANGTLSKQILTGALRKLSAPTVKQARAASPVDTGLLKKAIVVKSAALSTRRRHGVRKTDALVSLGALRKFVVGQYKTGKRAGKDRKAATQFAKAAYFHYGVEGRNFPVDPFIADAIDANRPRIEREFPEQVLNNYLNTLERYTKRGKASAFDTR